MAHSKSLAFPGLSFPIWSMGLWDQGTSLHPVPPTMVCAPRLPSTGLSRGHEAAEPHDGGARATGHGPRPTAHTHEVSSHCVTTQGCLLWQLSLTVLTSTQQTVVILTSQPHDRRAAWLPDGKLRLWEVQWPRGPRGRSPLSALTPPSGGGGGGG